MLTLVSLTTFAYDFEVDGIYYYIVPTNKETCRVTFKTKYSKTYSGSVVIPSKVTYNSTDYTVTGIGDDAFNNCTGLTSVSIPESVTSIYNNAFYNCSGLTKAEFASIESLCKMTFLNSSSSPLYFAPLYIDGKEIKDLVIPNSVTSISSYAFYGCKGLTSVTIPDNVSSIGQYAFSYCSGFTNVTLPNSLTSIEDRVFQRCSGLTSIIIPDNVTSIGQFAFESCTSLTDITLPSSLTSIVNSAFYKCSALTSIDIPENVKDIGYTAFCRCNNLTEVLCHAVDVPSLGSSVFSSSPVANCTLYVPEVSIEKYKSADQWNEFGKIMAIESYVPPMKPCAKPTIDYANGTIVCKSETQGAECHYTYTIKLTSVSGEGTDNGSGIVGGKITVTAYATADGFEDSEKVTMTFDYKDSGGCDVNADGKITMEDANIVVNSYLKN